MKRLATLIAASLVAASLAGCGAGSFLDKASTTYEQVVGLKVSPEAVQLARAAFNAAQVVATNYQRLPRCTGANAPICRDPALRTRIDAAVYAGRRARNELTRFLRDHPGELGPRGAYDALVAATTTIQDLTTAYRAAVGK